MEILTDRLPQTSPAWLDFAVTSRARNSIRHYLSNTKASEAIKVGKKLLEQALSEYNIKLNRRNNDHLSYYLQELILFVIFYFYILTFSHSFQNKK